MGTFPQFYEASPRSSDERRGGDGVEALLGAFPIVGLGDGTVLVVGLYSGLGGGGNIVMSLGMECGVKGKWRFLTSWASKFS